MVALIGIKSEKIYVKGYYKADCFRELHKQYPTDAYSTFPEPLKLVRL